ATLLEQLGQALSLIPLQNDGAVFARAAAAERVFQLLEPGGELLRLQLELFDHRDFLPTAPFALHPHHRARRPFRFLRRRLLRALRKIRELAAQRFERVVKRLLVVAHVRSQTAAKNPSVPSVCGSVRQNGAARRNSLCAFSNDSATSSFSARVSVQVA